MTEGINKPELLRPKISKNFQGLSDVDSFTPVSIGFKTSVYSDENSQLSAQQEKSICENSDKIQPPIDLKVKASDSFMTSIRQKRYVIVKPKDVKVFASSKFLDRIKYSDNDSFNHSELSKDYTQKAFEILNSFTDDKVDRNKLHEVNELLTNALEYESNNEKAIFGFAKLMTLLGEYRKAFEYINKAMELGYAEEELEELRLYVLEKFSKFDHLKVYAFEHKIQQRLYSVLQSERAFPPKISNDLEYLNFLQKKYEEIEKPYIELISKSKKNETLTKPFETLKKRYAELLEKSVLLNIITSNVQDNLNFLTVLDSYIEQEPDPLELKGKIALLLHYQHSFFCSGQNELEKLTFKLESDLPELLEEFGEKLNTLNLSMEEVYFKENDIAFLAFEVERTPKPLNMYGLKINLKDNTKLTGLLLKAIKIFPFLNSDNSNSLKKEKLKSYLAELELLLDFISQKNDLSVTGVLQSGLVSSLFLALSLTYLDLEKEGEYSSSELLEEVMKKIKLCLL